SFECRLDGGDRAADALRVLPLAEGGSERVPQDPGADRVRQPRLGAVARLDSRLSVLHENRQESAVVLPLGADLPGLGDVDRNVLETLSLERWKDRHDDLVARGVLVSAQLRVDGVLVRRGQKAREVVEPAVGRLGPRQRLRRDGYAYAQDDREKGEAHET